jgi:hypothetical protein
MPPGLLSKLAVARSRRPYSRVATLARETPRVPGRSPASHRAGPANGGLEAAGGVLFEDRQRRSARRPTNHLHRSVRRRSGPGRSLVLGQEIAEDKPSVARYGAIMNVTLRQPVMAGEQFFRWAQAQDVRYRFDGFQPVAMTGRNLRRNVMHFTLHRALHARLKGTGCRPWEPMPASLPPATAYGSRVRWPLADNKRERFAM